MDEGELLNRELQEKNNTRKRRDGGTAKLYLWSIQAVPIASTKPNLKRDTSLKTRKYDGKSGFSVISGFATTKAERRFCNFFNPPNQFLPLGIIRNDIRDSVLSMLVYVFPTEMTNYGYYMRGARSTSTVTLTPMRLHETCGLDVLLQNF